MEDQAAAQTQQEIRLYSYERFVEEAERLVRTLWGRGLVDGEIIVDCTLQSHDTDPFLPKEYQKQLKLTVRRPIDGILFKLSIMYSVTEQLPELFFTCSKKVQTE